MAVEYPVILAHNINRPGCEHLVWTSQVAGHESTRTHDGLRYTTWKATSTATQNLIIRAPNMLTNYGFEDGVQGWEVETTGTATATLSRTTDEAHEGDASAAVDVTAYTSGDIYLAHRKTFTLKAGATYHFRAAFKNDNATGDTIKLTIVDSVGSSLASATDATVGTSWEGLHVEYTPISDQNDVTVRVELPQAVRTNYVDTLWFGEVRAIDTLAIDQGHTLKGADITVEYRIDPLDFWSEASASAAVSTAGVYYRPFTGVKAADWRIVIANATTTPEIPGLYIGKRVILSHNPVSFDPDAAITHSTETTTAAGIVRDYVHYTRRTVRAQFENIGPTTEFAEWAQWWEDIAGGRYPFWWIWRPTSAPAQRLLLRLTDKTFSFPFDKFSRAGGFEGEEVRGRLEPA